MASEMLALQRWAVVGSHGRNPIASRLVDKLRAFGKDVATVDPKKTIIPSVSSETTTGATTSTVLAATSTSTSTADYIKLKEVPFSIECVDLVVNPALGIEVVKEMKELGIKNLWIQPGAGSEEIVTFCEVNKINFHHGCVLRELN